MLTAGWARRLRAIRPKIRVAGRRAACVWALSVAIAPLASIECGAAQTNPNRPVSRPASSPSVRPRAQNLSAPWSPVGPFSFLTPTYGLVSGRVTALVIDPADPSGNTVYLGATGGGVWKSVNAVGPASAVTFTPLTDTLPVFDLSAGSSATPSLSIGSLALGGGVLLAGTGDANNASDSYYGGGILRSTDGGLTWTLIQQSFDGVAGNHGFAGLSIAGLAFSTLDPSHVVAAVTTSTEGSAVNAGNGATSLLGLFGSTDAGVTWQAATVTDGSTVVASPAIPGPGATAVVWNPMRGRFYAVLQGSGYYESVDGLNWTRLANQPGATIASSCDQGHISSVPCPVFRGVLAVQPVTGDLFALTVDSSNQDQGLYQDVCAQVSGSCANPVVQFGARLDSTPLQLGSGSTVIPQGSYNLTLAAASLGSDTALYVGTIDLYRCSLAGGCLLRNTTNAQNGCASPAGVFGSQHAIAVSGSQLLLGNDGGLWRSLSGAAETGGPCSPQDATSFDNLNASLSSLTEVSSFAQDPANPATLLAGFGALGSAGTSAGGTSATGSWAQLSTGEGGAVAIDPANPLNWYLSTGAGVNIARCSKGSACAPADFLPEAITSTQVLGDHTAIHTPWMLDPQSSGQMTIGTCRIWRGPATGVNWASSDLLSGPFAAPLASGCSATFATVRSLALGGPPNAPAAAPNLGSRVLYAGLAGTATNGPGLAGSVFTTASADTANSSTQWTNVAGTNVTNASSDGGRFNPGRFDISSLFIDPHDPSGNTVYATILGFAGNGTNAPHLYRSTDGGTHWTNISSNLPNLPANSVVVDPNDANTLYLAMDAGVYVTSAVANCTILNCWSVYGTSLPDSPVIQLAAAPNLPTGDGRLGELRAGTHGRGIWQIPLLTALTPAAPVMALSPGSLTFSAQQVATQSAAQTILVTNSGNRPLLVTSTVVSADFTETDTCTGVSVQPAGTCAVSVRFLPQASGSRTGLLTLYANVAGGQAVANLSGTATAPAAIVITPPSLNFGQTNVGVTSAVQNLAISNTGGVPAALTSLTVSGDFAVTASSCGSALAPQSGCTVSIVFHPTAHGARTGTLTVVDDAGTQVAALTGAGTNPATDSLAPASLSFPLQQIGTSSPAQQVTLTNAGDLPLTLVTSQVSGDFSVVNGCGASLAPDSFCVFSVRFVPGRVGPETGTLTVTDAFRSQVVALSGIGAAPPGVSLSPVAGLAFAPTGLGLASPAQALTLTNNGDEPLSITGLQLPAAFLAGANTCNSLVPARSFCTVQISFTPAATGPISGRVSFLDNAPNSPQSAALTGHGVDFTLAADGPTSITIASGQTASYLLLLRSPANDVGSVAFTCSGLPAGATCSLSPPTPALGDVNGTVLTVTVATGQATTALSHRTPPWERSLPWLALALPLGLLPRRRRSTPTALALCLLLMVSAGCATVSRTIPASGTGPGTGGTPTPSGTYPILVSASSAGLVRSVNLTLVIQ